MMKAEYIWVDGTQPTKMLRAKTRVLPAGTTDLPQWSFDGSSTNQAEGHASDCLLEPVFVCPDPLRAPGDKLVLCEVLNIDGSPHSSNTRAALREAVDKHRDQEPWFGIEQEYTMWKGGRPFGWPEGGYPAPQGPFYCGVGADEVFGREMVEDHLDACIEAGLKIYGVNAEVMPGQWEFQVGTGGPSRGRGSPSGGALPAVSGGVKPTKSSVTLHPKPVRGDWNGAGAHTQLLYRGNAVGRRYSGRACEAMKPSSRRAIELHIANYGEGIEQRLTGLHETCSYREFKYGVSDRGASIRIPPSHRRRKAWATSKTAARVPTSIPYVVTRLLIETVCG